MAREFRLSLPGKGRGISCDVEGAFIGAIPVLRRLRREGREDWQPRSCDELSEEIGAHYGLPIDVASKAGGLNAIAKALNEGDVARAQIATVLLGIPDPPPLSKRAHSREQMIKLIRDLHWSGLIKADWDPDEHPRWPAGSPDSIGGDFAPKGRGAYDPAAEALLDAVAEAAQERDKDLPSLQRHFEQKYDNLGPADFSNQVAQFATWLEAHGKTLSPAARQRAIDEYDFVQDRLLFWQSYEHKPPAAALWMTSAADRLYQGAINGGIERAEHIPPYMVPVAVDVWGLEGGRSHIPSARAPNIRPLMPEESFEQLSGIVGNSRAESGSRPARPAVGMLGDTTTPALENNGLIGNSRFRNVGEFTGAVAEKYQALYDQHYAGTMQLVSRDLIPNDPFVIGRRTDALARVDLRDWLANDEAIDEGPGQIIQVNRRLYDPLGSGDYRVPDVYIPGSRTILDGSLQFKTGSMEQISDYHAYSGGANVTIIRPAGVPSDVVVGSYSIVH